MNALLLLCSVLGTVLCEPAIKRSLYDSLRNSEIPWKVVPYERNIFKDWTLEEVKNILKAQPVDVTILKREEQVLSCDAPENFDGRDKFKQCIHPPLDQANCGSCWAFSIAETLSDRLCINGKDVILAPQDLVSCDISNEGCTGGNILSAMQYAEEFGVVEESCFPYGSGSGPTPPCPTKCPSGQAWTKHRCRRGSTALLLKIDYMKCGIMNGPVSGRFDVYSDFLHYESGVYVRKTEEYIGGHAIKVLGFGAENGINYWICENSWGPVWGMAGYFKIGKGECDIDRYMVTCDAE